MFVLGHPRTGTTHLHYLLSKDSERFCFASTFHCGFPSAFLTFESLLKPLLRGVIDKTRPMDNVALDFDLPQEDELATNVLTAGTSPYMPLAFMRQEPEFRKFFTFENAAPSERQRWIDQFTSFLRKVTVRGGKAPARGKGNAQQYKQLLLKSPVHTARIPLLLSLFPDAKFIYIHRHPYDVFRSAVRMADTTYWYTYLNTPTNEQITEFILAQYELLFDEYIAGRALVERGNLLEVAFADLDAKPVETIAEIYEAFEWDGFEESLRPKLERYVRSLKGFKKNKHVDLTDAMKATVKRRWGPSFLAFGYTP